MPRKKQHYVDNEKFLIVMRDYRENYLKSKDDDTEPPQIPDYAGECFLKIAERLSHRPNFINYAFREEMVSDGIENCVMYASNFNPEKSTNPFAYFTQIIYYAFLRRIQREKKQLYIKHKSLERSLVFDELAQHDAAQGSKGDQGAYINLHTPYMTDFVENFERKEAEKKAARKTKKSNLEKFVEEPSEARSFVK